MCVCVCRREKKRQSVSSYLNGRVCAFVISASLFSFCPQTPPPVAAGSSLVASKGAEGEWGVPVTLTLGPPPVSVLQPPRCSKDMGTSLICRNYHPRAGRYTGTHKTEQERCLLALSPWMSVISKSGFMPHTLGTLHI